MSLDEEFGFGQYPDLLDAMPGLEDDLFPQRSETADENGHIELAFLPLRDIVLFPQMVMPLFVGRERSLAAVKAAIANDENMIVAAQRDSDVTDPGASDVYSRVQAEQILRKFFDEHVPSGFSVEHEGVSKMGDSYYIGRLRTANGEFRVTFFVKRMDSAELVKQLRIEPSKGDL